MNDIDEAALLAAAKRYHERTRVHAEYTETEWERLLPMVREHKTETVRQIVADYLAARVSAADS